MGEVVKHGGREDRPAATGGYGGDPYPPEMAITIFGAVRHVQMIIDALERPRTRIRCRRRCGCVLSSVYGFLSCAWPFGVVEFIWAGVALRRYGSISA